MTGLLREACGALVLIGALVLLGLAVTHLRDQEFVGALLLTFAGVMLVRSGVELLRPSMGE
jgi:hypothetical protein